MRSEVDKVVSSKEGEAKAARQEALKALRDAKDYAGEVARLKGEKEAKEKEVRWLFCQSGFFFERDSVCRQFYVGSSRCDGFP